MPLIKFPTVNGPILVKKISRSGVVNKRNKVLEVKPFTYTSVFDHKLLFMNEEKKWSNING
ncbi:CLUMA_CG012931, isoform A [Clunio marinus]|uniref:CLUMA_CG012931, isoform A n=1 Tax=Clunio marinus TaxID=568069 RepID=A0A1J1IHB8_9DIPT|nr:CLUMA_CG012931, isoform A [Clunio marinus]